MEIIVNRVNVGYGRSSDCQTERICCHNAYADSPAGRRWVANTVGDGRRMWKLRSPDYLEARTSRGGAHKLQT